MYKIMTPGPTQVRKNVLDARSKEFTNPDLDRSFFDFYKNLCSKLSGIMEAENSIIMGGEGILGLEAACVSLTEPNDRVLVLDNGIFGKGFADFVDIYNGRPYILEFDYKKPISVEELKSFLEKDDNFKYATLVHMDTPTGVLNDVNGICKLLKEHGILTVVDSVAGMFGEEISMKKGSIDILCSGSQKALSAAPGLTILGLSNDAIESMKNRKTKIGAFYSNILMYLNYYDTDFPYTMPISDILSLDVAIDNYLEDKDFQKRHRKLAEATRKALIEGGIELYLESGFSSNVTAFLIPDGLKEEDILNKMQDEHNIMIAGSLTILKGKVLRIGHMGENATKENVEETLKALDSVLNSLGFKTKKNLQKTFLEVL